MRTTVTLDADVEKLLKEESLRTQRSFKKVLNDSIRKSLKSISAPKPTLLPGKPLNLRTGIDSHRFNQMVDELEIEDFIEAQQQTKS
mgnify:CR=1 FL=1